MGEMQIAVLMRQDRLPSSRTAVIADNREVLVGCGGVESAGPAEKGKGSSEGRTQGCGRPKG